MKNSPKQLNSSLSNQQIQKLKQIYPGKGVAKIAGMDKPVRQKDSYFEKEIRYKKVLLAQNAYDLVASLEKKLAWTKDMLDMGNTPYRSEDMGIQDMENLCQTILLINSLDGLIGNVKRAKIRK